MLSEQLSIKKHLCNPFDMVLKKYQLYCTAFHQYTQIMNWVFITKYFILLISFLSLTQSQRVQGCIRYDLLEDQSIRCAQCLAIYGLTSKFTCELCGPLQKIVEGKCVAIGQEPLSQSTNQNSLQAIKPLNTVAPAVDNTTEKIKINSSTTVPTQSLFQKDQKSFQSSGSIQDPQNLGIQVQDPFGLFEDIKQNSFASNPKINSFSASPVQIQWPIQSLVYEKCAQKSVENKCMICFYGYSVGKQGKCEQQHKDPLKNCFVFSEMNNICLKCDKNYVLKDGACYSDQEISLQETQKSKQSQLLSKLKSKNDQFSIKASQQNAFIGLGVIQKEKESDFAGVSFQNQLKIDNSFSSFGQVPDSTFEASPIQLKKQQIVHKFPQYPFCYEYEEGQCWACIPGYVLNLIINKCVKSEIKTAPAILKKAESLQDGDKKPFSSDGLPISTTPDEFCNIYSQQKNECKQCFRNYYFNSQTKLCTMVDARCRTFEYIDGNCVSCYKGYSLQDGKCLHD